MESRESQIAESTRRVESEILRDLPVPGLRWLDSVATSCILRGDVFVSGPSQRYTPRRGPTRRILNAPCAHIPATGKPPYPSELADSIDLVHHPVPLGRLAARTYGLTLPYSSPSGESC